jgi:hypothetical protein
MTLYIWPGLGQIAEDSRALLAGRHPIMYHSTTREVHRRLVNRVGCRSWCIGAGKRSRYSTTVVLRKINPAVWEEAVWEDLIDNINFCITTHYISSRLNNTRQASNLYQSLASLIPALLTLSSALFISLIIFSSRRT